MSLYFLSGLADYLPRLSYTLTLLQSLLSFLVFFPTNRLTLNVSQARFPIIPLFPLVHHPLLACLVSLNLNSRPFLRHVATVLLEPYHAPHFDASGQQISSLICAQLAHPA